MDPPSEIVGKVAESNVLKVDHEMDYPVPNGDDSKPGVRERMLFILVSFLGFFNIFTMRVDLSVAIVAMAKSVDSEENPNTTLGCSVVDFGEERLIDQESTPGEFSWSTTLQGHILGAFFYGYVSGLLPGGPLAERFGGEWIFGIGELLMSISSILVPVVVPTTWGAEGLIMLRIICGFGAGVTYPAMHNLIARWIPESERSRASTFIWSGVQVGIIVGMPLSGALAGSLGWRAIFYVFGGSGAIWFCVWCLCIKGGYFIANSSSPNKDTMTDGAVLQKELHKDTDTNTKRLPFPPLRYILTTPAFLALTVVHFGQSWGYITLMTEIPSYLSNVHHYSITSNGIISALPYLCMVLCGLVCGWIADWLINSQRLTITNTRKLFQFIGHWIPALALLVLAYGIGCGDHTLAILLLCVAVGVNGASYSGYQINHVELSPNYAGTLMGLTGAIANTAGFISPYIVGIIVEDQQTMEAWSIVFLIASIICVVFNVMFLVFGTSERQWWDTYWESEENASPRR